MTVGYKKFEVMISDTTLKYLAPRLQKYIDNPNSQTIDKNDIKHVVIHGYGEIISTENTLEMITLLIKSPPPEVIPPKEHEYLSFLIQSYLHELYILKERLNSLATKVLRGYKKAYKHEFLEKEFDPLFKTIKSTLEAVVNIRSKHVHAERYIPEEISWIDLLKITSLEDPVFSVHAEASYEIEKRKWLERIEHNKKEIHKLFDVYFNYLYSTVSINGKFIYPAEIDYNKDAKLSFINNFKEP